MTGQSRKTIHRFRSVPYRVPFFLLFFFLVFSDQITKWLAVRTLRNQSGLSLISGILELTYLENRGIAWGMFQGKLDFLLIFTLLFFCAMFYIFLRITSTSVYIPFTAALTGMTAGAAGNYIDRVFRGYVIDFIFISMIDFPVFNVADIYVTVSLFLILFLMIFIYKEEDFDEIIGKKSIVEADENTVLDVKDDELVDNDILDDSDKD